MEEFIDDLRKLEHSNFRGSSSSGGNYPKTDDPSAATLVPLDPDVDQFIGFTNSSSFFNLNDHHLQLIQMASDTTRLHNNQSSFFSTPPPYDLQPPYDVVAHQPTSLSSSLRPGGFGMESSKSLSMVMKAGYVESSSSRASGSDDLNGSRKADRNNDNNNKTGSGSRKRKRNTKDGLGMGVEKPPAEQVIHVRAKRGQATDSHSLAERVRRERINEKLRVLQDLVPGCYKTMGMAVMLDVIINYVHSLQNQIDFLSMKLSAASLFYDFNSPEAEAIEALQKASSGEAFDIERMVKEGTIGGPLPHPHIQSSSWPIIN